MIRFFIFFTLLFSFFTLLAGGDNFPIGARSNALGNASVTLKDIYAAGNNQAGLAYLTKTQASVYYQRRFMLDELSYSNAIGVLPTRSGTFALSVNYFGFSDYNEGKIGIGFGKQIWENIAAGIQVDLLNTSISGYGSRFNVTFEAGIMADITDELTFGVHIYNPIRANMGEYLGEKEKTPAIFRAGINYYKDDKFALLLELHKDIDFPPAVRAGIEYYFVDAFIVRAGVGTGPANYNLGVGIHLEKLHIDVCGGYHQYLGFTPSIALNYLFGNKDDAK